MTAQSCFVPMPGRVLQLSSVDEALAWLKAVGVRSCSVTAAVCSPVMLSSPGPVWPPMGGVMCCLPFKPVRVPVSWRPMACWRADGPLNGHRACRVTVCRWWPLCRA